MINTEYEFFLKEEIRPKGFSYPSAYVDCVSGDLPDLEPWHFFYSRLEYRYNGLKERYPSRILVPFARRQDNDDVACFDASSGEGRVLVIHDFASPGWELRLSFDDFDAWLEFVKS